ncbi:MAG: methyltransferase family protein [Candidatus Hodarchaeota archaeon]
MSLAELIGLINFILLNLCAFLCFFFYILSSMPNTREEKIGEKAWRQSNTLRLISDILWLVLILNIILWIWFPIPILNWKILDNYSILLLISIPIAFFCVFLIVKAVKDAGTETVKTSKDTEMYQGIYNYIRHPQIFGSVPLFFVLSMIINSLFLLIWLIFLMIIIIPIVIHYEEKDLIKRFGDKYLQYKKETGALIPKFWKKKN